MNRLTEWLKCVLPQAGKSREKAPCLSTDTSSATDITQLYNALRHIQQQLLEEITAKVSIKHGGFTSSATGNKGIREGLRLAKECVRSVDPCWVQVFSWDGLAEDQKQYLDNLLHQIQQHPPKAADCLLNQQQRQAILSSLTTLKQDISSNASHTLDNRADTLKLTDIQTDKRQFINTISERIKQILIHFSDKDVEINTQLVSLQSLPAQQYLNSTQLVLEPSCRAVLQQALDNINAQQQLFNALPGDEGVYELVGLSGAAEVISQKLRTITNNQSQTKA